MNQTKAMEAMSSARLRKVGSVAESRLRSNRAVAWLNQAFHLAEYFGYIATFYLLMAIRVMPGYPEASRFNPFQWGRTVLVINEYMLFLAIFLVIHIFTRVQNELHNGKVSTSWESFVQRSRSSINALLLTLGITFLFKTTFLYSRVTLVLFLVMIVVEAAVWVLSKKWILGLLNKRGVAIQHVLIVGAGKVGLELAEKLFMKPSEGFRLIGYLDDIKEAEKVIGKISDLERVLNKSRVDVIYVTIPSEKALVEKLLTSIYKYDVDIRIIPEMFDRMSGVFTFRNDSDYPCLQIVKTPLRGLNIALKRMADMVGSFFLLVVAFPIFLLSAILIKADSKGPVFYRQVRVGKHGRTFRMIKFRSMYEEAEKMQDQLVQRNEVKDGPAFKLKDDPRITKVGRFLRKYSIDELPQLFNVLKGEMSLIGPRPPLPREVELYSDYHWRRMDVLPGMTGLWQVSGRSDLDFKQWIDLDIYYIEHWSVYLELKILIKTIPAVLKGEGAY